MKRFLVGLVLALTASSRPSGWLQAQQCGGTERWPVKVGTDSRSTSVQLLSPVTITLHDLINLPTPHMPPLSDNTTRLNEETHVYEVTGRLIKFKHETDADYHLVVTDETLIFTDDQAGTPPGHSVIVE